MTTEYRHRLKIYNEACEAAGMTGEANYDSLPELIREHLSNYADLCEVGFATKLRDQLTTSQLRVETLESALEKIIKMNLQHAQDQHGDAAKAENWSCVVVARAALSTPADSPSKIEAVREAYAASKRIIKRNQGGYVMDCEDNRLIEKTLRSAFSFLDEEGKK